VHEPEPPLAPAIEAASEAATVTHCAEHDFGVTLALAQESAAMGLWTESRELLQEVLQGAGQPALRDQAQTLLAEIEAK
jgi:FimV-like protein